MDKMYIFSLVAVCLFSSHINVYSGMQAVYTVQMIELHLILYVKGESEAWISPWPIRLGHDQAETRRREKKTL